MQIVLPFYSTQKALHFVDLTIKTDFIESAVYRFDRTGWSSPLESHIKCTYKRHVCDCIKPP